MPESAQAQESFERELSETLLAQGIDVTQLATDENGTLMSSWSVDQALDDLPLLGKEQLRYLGLLGEGGMGSVDRAIQLSLGREIAAKRARSEEAKTALAVEGRITGYLEHPNIVPVHTLGRDEEGEVILAMKRIDGRTWEDAADLPLEEHLRILVDLCKAAHFAHTKGVLHRDIKPDNVMLDELGEVYLMDWGIAAGFTNDAPENIPRAHPESLAGTPTFMAPEMLDTECALDARSDVYLLGASLFRVLSGRMPHEGSTILQIFYSVKNTPFLDPGEEFPEALRAICRKATCGDSEQRYGSADELRQAVEHYIKHASVLRMVERAKARLDELEGLIEGGGSEADATRTYHELLFAFRQALEDMPSLQDATRGLDRAHELMARRELRAGRLESAEEFLHLVDAPGAELRLELDELRARRAESERQALEDARSLEQLRARARERDVSIGQRARAFILANIGVSWCLLMFFNKSLMNALGFDSLLELLFAAEVATIASLSLMLLFFRRYLLKTEASKSMFIALCATTTGCMLVFGYGAFLGLASSTAIGTTHILMVAVVSAAYPYEKRVIPMAVILAPGIAIPLVEEWAPQINGVLVMLALLTAIWTFRDADTPSKDGAAIRSDGR